MSKRTLPALIETEHRVHDYRHLIARWRRVARAAGLRLEALAQAGDYTVYRLQTRGTAPGGLYLSAGIHGDEPAAAEGLIVWAERHLAALVRAAPDWPILILPCLNPWGLVNNQRGDAQGRDLNRLFDRHEESPIREWKRLLAGRSFALGVSLHEDYDARGIYLYEINQRPPDLGLELLAAASAAVPIDQRSRIDGRPFKAGRALRRANLARFPLHPEAIDLHLHHGGHVLTFETPSEFSLERRVQAHVLLLEACVERVRARRP